MSVRHFYNCLFNVCRCAFNFYIDRYLTCVGFLLDSFARQHLWQIGLDYLHGTGHGVGSFLNVHEG